ncbi:hypothetical protein ASD67_17545 [Sphingopyxis sp. Root1497]|uniref:alpha/beta fold hydrolase n=1 Tax=Sphingopyxis sp. Root1497 TaxID=1736474 RepID=UPI0006FFAE21|nr:alpha/beta hydrolase [Sphingopyxis sp. Root1497]KQZ61079.1 hypothetical protein ASD67_17545 [Sphingopyxis sp. Root1497]
MERQRGIGRGAAISNGSQRRRYPTRRLGKSVGLLFAPAPLLLAACSSTPIVTPSLPLDAYAQPGTLVKVDAQRALNIRCTGKGGPAVILTAGAGDQSLAWRSIQSSLSAHGRVCAWDRAGSGFSDPSSDVQDVEHRTHDLERLLSGAGIKPPYILVGHSIGSFETLMFAFRHPAEVAGIVLIDPSSPDQNDRIREAAPAFYAILDPLQKGQLAQLEKCVSDAGRAPDIADPDCLAPPTPEYPQALQDRLARIDRQTAGKRNFLSMLDAMMSGRDSAQLKASWRALGDLPLVVLTAGSPPPLPVTGKAAEDVPRMQAEWARMHDDIAHLSTRGVNRTVAGASHYIYMDQPETVLAAIADIWAQARSRSGTGSGP